MSLHFEIPQVFANSAIYERVGAIIKDKATGVSVHPPSTRAEGSSRSLKVCVAHP